MNKISLELIKIYNEKFITEIEKKGYVFTKELVNAFGYRYEYCIVKNDVKIRIGSYFNINESNFLSQKQIKSLIKTATER